MSNSNDLCEGNCLSGCNKCDCPNTPTSGLNGDGVNTCRYASNCDGCQDCCDEKNRFNSNYKSNEIVYNANNLSNYSTRGNNSTQNNGNSNNSTQNNGNSNNSTQNNGNSNNSTQNNGNSNNSTQNNGNEQNSNNLGNNTILSNIINNDFSDYNFGLKHLVIYIFLGIVTNIFLDHLFKKFTFGVWVLWFLLFNTLNKMFSDILGFFYDVIFQ